MLTDAEGCAAHKERPRYKVHNVVSRCLYANNFRYGPRMDIGYALVSTAKQDLERQIDALTAAVIPAERIYLDKKSGATTDRPGLHAIVSKSFCSFAWTSTTKRDLASSCSN